ncbi:MAG: hypothetical protein IT458_20200 [Planctomycetes bacterium]|nr:hypothetical protein [Planctomycetota bacterium]
MRTRLLLLILAAAVRGLVALRTEVPARDGATYLWMAERCAAGEPCALFATVFHPLYAALTGAWLRWLPAGAATPELAAMAAGQWVACACAALAVLPLHALTERHFGARAALAAGVLYALGAWFARHPAECMSEGPFFLWVAGCAFGLTAAGPGAVGMPLLAGVLAGLAFLTRPEGAALALLGAPWLWLRGARAAALLCAGAAAAVACLLPLGAWLCGQGLVLTPKAGFVYADGIGQPGVVPVLHYFTELGQTLLAAAEAVGFVALPLAVAGLWLRRPWSLRDPAALLAGLFALQVLVVPLLRSNLRFLAGYGMLLLPLAGLAWQRLAPLVAPPRFVARLPLLFLAFLPDLMRLPQARGAERVVERELGLHLRPQLRDGARLATEMPRLHYFAGQRPGPPREIRPEEVLADARGLATRFVAWVPLRTPLASDALVALGYRPAVLPEPLARSIAARGILVYER